MASRGFWHFPLPLCYRDTKNGANGTQKGGLINNPPDAFIFCNRIITAFAPGLRRKCLLYGISPRFRENLQ